MLSRTSVSAVTDCSDTVVVRSKAHIKSSRIPVVFRIQVVYVSSYLSRDKAIGRCNENGGKRRGVLVEREADGLIENDSYENGGKRRSVLVVRDAEDLSRMIVTNYTRCKTNLGPFRALGKTIKYRL